MRKNILILLPVEPFARCKGKSYILDLKSAIEEKGHDVDICTVSVNYDSLDSLWKQMYQWSLFDFTSFSGKQIDSVICTKWPSYYIKHPNKKIIFLEDIEIMLVDIEKMEKEEFLLANKRILEGFAQKYSISEFISKRVELSMGIESSPFYFHDNIRTVSNVEPRSIISINNSPKYNKLLLDAMEGVIGKAIIITDDKEEYWNFFEYINLKEYNNIEVLFCTEHKSIVHNVEDKAAVYYYGIDKYTNCYPAIASALYLKPIICVKDKNEDIFDSFIRESEIDITEFNCMDVRKAIKEIFDIQENTQKKVLLEKKMIKMNKINFKDIDTVIY